MTAPMVMTNQTLFKIHEHCRKEFPKEMCGLLTEWDFIPVENIADDPEKSFKIDPTVYLRHEAETIAILHSHCNNTTKRRYFDLRTPSPGDLKGQKRTAKPWGIIGNDHGEVSSILWIPRDRTTPLFSRPFVPFVFDCLTFVQDYHFQRGNKFPDYPDEVEDWTNQDLSFKRFEPYLNHEGFQHITSVNDLQSGDVIVLDYKGRKCSHIGVYHEGELWHQDTLASKEPLTNFYGNIVKVMRYVG